MTAHALTPGRHERVWQTIVARAIGSRRSPQRASINHTSTSARGTSMYARFLCCVAATLVTGAAFAQSTAPQSDSKAAPPKAEGRLEEVIVTANRREQSTQDVGISLAAFSGEELETLPVNTGSDVVNITPNMSMVR